ncbi:MAG: cobaltochelatase subunit CobN, partial [Paracoccaceae bacterium]|nr:cobaltochelatase subunit CobN [Paracoccaceae bacterium]
MHLLAATPGGISDGSEAIDLGQSPGDIVVLSAADTDLMVLSAARESLASAHPGFPSLRLASLLHLGHNMSVDLYADAVLRHAKLIVVRLLGGRGYWPYGVDETLGAARACGARVVFVPGDDQADAELVGLSTTGAEAHHRLWQYLALGGPANAEQFLRYAATLIGYEADWREPEPLLNAGFYWPGAGPTDRNTLASHWQAGRAGVAVVFYRALVQAGNLDAVDALVGALDTGGLNVLP